MSTDTPTSEHPLAAVATPDEPAPESRRRRSLLPILGIVVSIVALGGVVWWATKQEAPTFPSTAGEISALRLGTIHNLWFLLDLMRRIRAAIEAGRFADFHAGFLEGYRITDQGRALFRELLRETSQFGFLRKHPINLALAFIAHLPPEERVTLLQERLHRLESLHDVLARRREELRFLEAQEPWVLATLDHDLGHCEFEIGWTRHLLDQVRQWVPRAGHEGMRG